MGSGQKSNGKRPVNKVDGGKKKAKKQMSKTRRADAKKEEKVTKILVPKILVRPNFDFFDDEYDSDFDDDDDTEGFGDW